MGWGAGRDGEKAGEINKYKLSVTNSTRDVEVSAENTVKNIAAAKRSTRGYWTYWGDHFVMYGNVRPLCCAPETNMPLYASCNLKIKNYLIYTTRETKTVRFHFCVESKRSNS